MKSNRPLNLLIIILVVWNIIVTSYLFTIKESNVENKTIINETTISGFSTDLTKVYDETKSSIVTIETSEYTLSGFIYEKKGNTVYIVSCYHGIDNSNPTVTFASGLQKEAKLKGFDIYADIAILEVELQYEVKSIHKGDSTLLSNGEMLVAIGTPQSKEFAHSIEMGLVANKLVTIENSITYNGIRYNYLADMIQLSSNLQPGYSGSPILNMNGEVVGVCCLNAKNEVTLAMPINEVTIIADSIINDIAYRKINYGITGLYVEELETYEKAQLEIALDINTGLYVRKVQHGLFFNKLGIKEKDVITKINEVEIKNQNDLLKIQYNEAVEYTIEVYRNGEKIILTGNYND